MRCNDFNHAAFPRLFFWLAWFSPVFAQIIGFAPSIGFAQSVVRLESTEGRYRLLRDGAAYTVRGVGGQSQLELLAQLGGNSIRTWSAEGLGELLDAAHQRNLTVCVGMWLGHERHGFNYQNEEAVVKQWNECLSVVRKYKDHPAVLMWGIGNEMEGNGTNPAIWYAIDHIAREIHRIDPNHPTMTVIAELGESQNKVRSLERFCPSIDIVGINSYAGAASVGKRYREAGGTKPYLLTEHGPRGPWEVEKTAWGAPLESTSTEKATLYADGYRANVIEGSDLCLGSYAFLWGNKQETTATWFGMILPDGSRLGAADAMSALWTGKPPIHRCPEITALRMEGSAVRKPGETIKATLDVSDPEGDPLRIEWILRADSAVIGVGGDAQSEEKSFRDAITSDGRSARVALPEGGGGYRLFAIARDPHGGAAVANVAFRVDAAKMSIASPKTPLPFRLYTDRSTQAPYVPSGFMGNVAAIALNEDSDVQPHSGTSCIQASYRASDAWGGVLWQSPPNDWKGEQPGGLDLSGAKALEFWVRGAEGDEVVNFMIGVVDGNVPYRDSAKAELKEIRLTREWQKHRLPLDGADLSRIKTGFGWSLAGQGKPVTFFVDDIEYVAE